MQCSFVYEFHIVVFNAEQEEIFSVIRKEMPTKFQDAMKSIEISAHKSINARINSREYFVFSCSLGNRSYSFETLILQVGMPLRIDELKQDL